MSGPTLTRFFRFHFILPLIIVALVAIHIIYLHDTGSNSPLGATLTKEKLPFSSLFLTKDGVRAIVIVWALMWGVLTIPDILGDPENFNPANPMVTPIHIQPEWYYLFAYAILRSIPRKLGGVVALALSVAILYLIPILRVRVRRPGRHI